MNIENKTPKEIQQEIFTEIEKGVNVENLKQELREKGVLIEGYYFTTEKEHTTIKEATPEAANYVSGKQVFWAIITIVILLFKIIRCSSRM